MIDMIALTADYQQWKLAMLAATGLAKDALHVHVGLLVFVATRLAWRWRFGWLVAWLVALAFAAGGEWLDLRTEAQTGALQPDAGHWHDLWNTMIWPTVLALVGRWLVPQARAAAVAEPEAEPLSVDSSTITPDIAN
jgi:hypothetical protein